MITQFACTLAWLNGALRLLFSMGKYRFLHHSMGFVHRTHRTPHRASFLAVGLVAATSLALAPLGFLKAFGHAGTLASFSFVAVYLALCIIGPMDLRKSGEMKPRHIVVGITGAALMLFVIFGSVYPVPVYPFNLLPYVFIAYMLVGGLWFAVLRAKSPQTLISIQHDLEG
jgi:amino acid transporter